MTNRKLGSARCVRSNISLGRGKHWRSQWHPTGQYGTVGLLEANYRFRRRGATVAMLSSARVKDAGSGTEVVAARDEPVPAAVRAKWVRQTS